MKKTLSKAIKVRLSEDQMVALEKLSKMEGLDESVLARQVIHRYLINNDPDYARGVMPDKVTILSTQAEDATPQKKRRGKR